MSWSTLFCSLLGCYQQDHIPEHCMLTVSTLTRETRSQTHAWVRAHAHRWVNALTQTRESPTERLFRGITWLLGNSVVLPHRHGYFRLLICLFFSFMTLCFGPPRNCSHGDMAVALFYVYLCIQSLNTLFLCLPFCELFAKGAIHADAVRQGY